MTEKTHTNRARENENKTKYNYTLKNSLTYRLTNSLQHTNTTITIKVVVSNELFTK